MSTMRAVYITATGDSSILKVSNIPKPVPKPNEVLVKIHFVGVNFGDTLYRAGKRAFSLPGVLGAEASGEIVEIGSDVTHYSVGDRVALLGGATYAEYTVVRDDLIAKVPDGVSYEKAAAALAIGMTSLGLVKLGYEVKKGDWVLIHAAAGGIGLVLCQLCKQAGAHVIGTTSSDTKAEMVKRAGADHVLNYKTHTNDQVFAQIEKLTNGRLVHVVFDSVGADMFDLSLRSTRDFGTVVEYGIASGEVPPFNLLRLGEKSTTLKFFNLHVAIATREGFTSLANEVLKLVEDGKLDLNISKIYTLDQVKEVHDALESRQTIGKLLLKIQ
ncbi:NADPH:quinone reductase [Actinomortierella ambigua]|uniref:NADPH:quinone reductase n=1 Tax=Actinomortierella ambigua TaxID=1343610 RepID=A0A9P6UBE9_9FUNG|nr:NADPH:quinone reductase [Actinomortierella ambigua]